MSLRERALDRAARIVPGQIGAVIDGLRPSLAHGFGGPFNGQERRMEAVREMFATVPFAVVIETGTYRATTTLFLRDLTPAPLATIEASSRYYHYARKRLLGAKDITLIRGESSAVIHSIAVDSKWNRDPAFFYLDAHWGETLPLPAELEEIAGGWRNYAVLIDDFRVPDDPGYAYDNYGEGKALAPAILASLADRSLSIFWPAAPSNSETGARRGCVVIGTTGPVDEGLRSIAGLRLGGTLDDVVDAAARGGAVSR